jgi:hypothetical protein
MSEGIGITSLVTYPRIVFGRKRRFIVEYVGLSSVTSLLILVLVTIESLLGSESLASHQLSDSLNLSNAWTTVFVIFVSFLALVAFRLSVSKEVHKEAALFMELGASRKSLFGLYLLRALLLGLFAGVTGFSMTLIFSMFQRLVIDTSLLTFSILMVSSATFVSELVESRGMNRSDI